jgi:hypothetical protein
MLRQSVLLAGVCLSLSELDVCVDCLPVKVVCLLVSVFLVGGGESSPTHTLSSVSARTLYSVSAVLLAF